MKWFRLYSEARNDAKLRALSDAQHRVWFNLLCYASEMEERGCIKSVDRELLAVECCGADIDLLNETLEKLVRLEIIECDGDSVIFIDFNPLAEPTYRSEWRSLSKILAPIIFLRDGYKCTYCHDTAFLSVDHIQPLSRGGGNELENLTTACRSCNSRKSDKTLEEWSR